MEKRKLVKSGLFSYTISLPKEWIERHKLDKGSTIYLDEQVDGLFVKAGESKKDIKESKDAVLKIDGMTKNSVIRNIVASYLTNKDTLTLLGKDLSKNIDEYKKNISDMLPGFEVIEETSEMLLIKNFININELIVPDLLRRADNITRSLILDTYECFKTNDIKLGDAIRKRDKEVNRLAFLIFKCLNYISEHPHQSRIHGVHPMTIAHIWELNNYVERLADEIKRIAPLIPSLKHGSEDRKKIEKLFSGVEKFYLETMTALYKHDIEQADKSADERHDIRKECNQYLEISRSPVGRSIVGRLVYMTSFINSISRLIRYVSFEKHMTEKGSAFN